MDSMYRLRRHSVKLISPGYYRAYPATGDAGPAPEAELRVSTYAMQTAVNPNRNISVTCLIRLLYNCAKEHESYQSIWSPPLMDIRNPRGAECGLPAFFRK
ncbi:hypothetical protein EVAR_88986_1 [Eumeta japonica]|uniref:Uncharacterized protein n=1 Tax=Eumeta variegata TaxID=151549 RepID=A0A4C1VSZ3_EUMVA|nr:hypothetical protein EVAR_88986_1 [Eumeta japonica]